MVVTKNKQRAEIKFYPLLFIGQSLLTVVCSLLSYQIADEIKNVAATAMIA